MSSLVDVSESVELELSQAESLALVDFVRRLVEEVQGDCDVSALRNACDKLEEADAVGRWLREGVRAELTPVEAREISEALSVRLDEDALLASLAEDLDDIRRQLQAGLSF
jgi:hypothetical protein